MVVMTRRANSAAERTGEAAGVGVGAGAGAETGTGVGSAVADARAISSGAKEIARIFSRFCLADGKECCEWRRFAVCCEVRSMQNVNFRR